MTRNEKRSNIPHVLESLSIPYTETDLKVGDYFVGSINADGSMEGVAVERKAMGDYIGSLTSGHLNNQLYELSYNFPFSYLVVIGYLSQELFYRKIPRELVISSLVGSSLKRAPDGASGVVCTVNLENEWDFGHFLKHLDGKLTKDEQRIPMLQKKKWNPNELLPYIVSGFPNVGPITAKKLLQHFGSIKNLVNASIEDLQKVDGIGQKKADLVWRLINMEYRGDSL